MGNAIAELRERAGMSRPELAAAAQVSAEYIRKLEKGEINRPSLYNLTKIAIVFGIDANDLQTFGTGGEKVLGLEFRTDDAGHEWLHEMAATYAPNTPPELARELIGYFDKLDANGRKAAIKMLRALAEQEGEEERAEE